LPGLGSPHSQSTRWSPKDWPIARLEQKLIPFRLHHKKRMLCGPLNIPATAILYRYPTWLNAIPIMREPLSRKDRDLAIENANLRAAWIVAAFCIPFLWYFLLDRLREISAAILGRDRN
jgi:hypothetical protein